MPDRWPWLTDPVGLAVRIRRGAQLRSAPRAAQAPYSIELYRGLLTRLSAMGTARFVPFDAPQRRRLGHAAIVVRHDIDTPGCVANAHLLFDVDQDLDVPAAVFVRTDELDYPAASAVDLVHDATSRGMPVGLHSSCYLDAENPVRSFAVEIDRFEQLFGSRPRYLTMHGLGDQGLDVRRRFVAAVSGDLRLFGLQHTDASPLHRRYSHVFEDCHRDAGGRFLAGDVEAPQSYVAPAGTYLVLTHPGYWRKDPGTVE